MNRIEEMIKVMCPEGVKRVTISSFATVLRGKRLTKKQLSDKDKYPVYHGGQEPIGYYHEFNRTGDTVMIINVGASAGTIGYCNKNFWSSDGCYCISRREDVNNKYLYAALLEIEPKIKSNVRYAGIPTLDKDVILNLEIPLPPLPIQQEIVKILDSFTALQQNLEDELKLRQKQYEHYREKLLTFEDEDDDVEWKKLGECCNIKGRIGFRGYTREDQVKEGEGALALSPANIEDSTMTYENNTFITWDKYNESPEIMTFNGDIIFCKTGSTVGKVAFVSKLPYKATINPQLVVLKDIMIESKYLYYILRGFRIQRSVTALAGVGSVPNISQAKLSDLLIPVPPLNRQLQITQTLDNFESLISNLKTEIELRKKQYEYYREKLLTF